MTAFLQLSQAEQSNGQLTPETVEAAVNQVRLNGFVVLENAIPVDLVDTMNGAFLQAYEDLRQSNAAKTEVNTNDFRANRIRMDLPFRAPFIDPQVITNPFALPIIERILSEDCRMFYFSCDAPLPGSQYQRVHGDYAPFYPDSDVILPITGLVVNYPLVNVTEENGPLEVWPNTHLTPEKFYKGDYIMNAAKNLTPVRMLTPKGSLIVRDIRMWHRGTPNVSNEIRPNMALIYGRGWWDGAFYPQDSLGVTEEVFAGLSARAKKLLRFEKLVN